jgi:heat-inducible transcriptional repressor
MSEGSCAERLTDRERVVLVAIIEDYIASGDPVGSRTITKHALVSCSAATVRNVMCDLGERGLLTQPHTSAGRIPTDRAFRFYVDSEVRVRRAENQPVMDLGLGSGADRHELLEEATRRLSSLSQQAGVTLAPRRDGARFHHLELVLLPDTKVLVIVVDQAGSVQNKILEPDPGSPLGQDALNEMARLVNQRCRGMTLKEARAAVLDEMRQARSDMNTMMTRALALTDSVLQDAERSPKDVIVAGEANVLEKPEFSDVDRMKGLLRAFEERHVLVRLLDKIDAAHSVQVFIGAESGFREMANCSVVAAQYGAQGQPQGVVGVIGPVRMDYARVVPLVEMTAQMVSRLLSG